jgi:hypothetical protein
VQNGVTGSRRAPVATELERDLIEDLIQERTRISPSKANTVVNAEKVINAVTLRFRVERTDGFPVEVVFTTGLLERACEERLFAIQLKPAELER